MRNSFLSSWYIQKGPLTIHSFDPMLFSHLSRAAATHALDTYCTLSIANGRCEQFFYCIFLTFLSARGKARRDKLNVALAEFERS